jgi:DNA-binding transcriptional LysR family regulator
VLRGGFAKAAAMTDRIAETSGPEALTLRQFRYFLMVAETGSVSRAAGEVGISQSAITAAIQALEEELGSKLFLRHQKGMRLTSEGHRMLRHARFVLNAVADARAAMRERPEEMEGALNIGVTRLVAGYYLADVLSRFQHIFRKVKIRLVEDERSYLEHLLVGGELDIGLMIVSNLADRQALQSEILQRSPWRVWLPAQHPLLARSVLEFGDFRERPFVMLATDELADTSARLSSDGIFRPPIVMKTNSVEAVRSLVGNGLGLALLPDLAYRPWSLEGDRIEARHVAGSLPTVDIGLAWRRGAPLSLAMGQFIELCRDYSQGRGGRLTI